MKKERIDKLLIERKLAENDAKAKAMIMAGVVLVNEKRVEKSSETYSPDISIRIKGNSNESKYVGRGGLKLEKALSEFHIFPTEYVCLDIGASTGGFTDCLLQKGAKKVVAVDAGTNQIDWRLRSDARVEVRENTNARYLKPEDFEENFDLIVIDVSFISIVKILPALLPLLKTDGKIVALIKPQFEVSKDEIGKGGIVRDPEQHKTVVSKINDFAGEIGLNVLDVIESPILGAAGNKEFLAFYEKSPEI